MTGTYTPKYIWKHTEQDGNLPIANFTSDVRIASKKPTNAMNVKKASTGNTAAEDICRIANFDINSDDEDSDNSANEMMQ